MSPASSTNLRVAVVGYGSIGRRHFDNLAALGVQRRLVVRRRNPNPAMAPPPGTPIVHSAGEAITAGVDLAIICNPTSLHASAAMEFIGAGVPVLVEKPLSDDPALAEQLVAAARRGGVPCGMAYGTRYHPAYRLAKEALAAGRIGRVLYAKAWFESYLPDWHPWEDYRISYAARPDLGGGALPTLDHEIDYLNWCLGEPRQARGAAVHTGALSMEVNDAAHLLLDYPRGVTAALTLSLCRRDRSRGFEFIGETGVLTFRWEQPLLQLATANETHTLWREPDYDVNAMYVAMLADALNAIAAGKEPPATLECGLKAARVCGQLT